MSRNLHLSKVSVRRVTSETDYADNEDLIESLNTMRAVWNVPIENYIRDLLDRKVDAVSLTKDKPYYYFFARRFEKSLSITIKESEKVVDFSIPLHEAQKMLIV